MPPTTFQEQVRQEREELADKLVKLNVFVKTDIFNNLPTADQLLLISQAAIMQKYYDVLTQRIERFN